MPFQRSANKFASEAPTAKQLVVLAHDTPLNSASDTPLGFGLATIDQLTPFQWSTNVVNDAFEEAGFVSENPTAEQSLAFAQDTPSSTPSADPLGFGLGTIDQADPFHPSINVAVAVLPTAKQLVADAHDTPARPAPTWPVGFGLGTIDQANPFHRSINDARNVPPTAKQTVADAHDTAETEPLGGPGGLGLGVTDQTGTAPDGTATTVNIPATRATATNNRTTGALHEPDSGVQPLIAHLYGPFNHHAQQPIRPCVKISAPFRHHSHKDTTTSPGSLGRARALRLTAEPRWQHEHQPMERRPIALTWVGQHVGEPGNVRVGWDRARCLRPR